MPTKMLFEVVVNADGDIEEVDDDATELEEVNDDVVDVAAEATEES